MRIGTRLSTTFGAIMLLSLLSCVLASVQLARLNEQTQHIVKERVARQAVAAQAQSGTYFTALYLFRAIAEHTPEAMQADLDLVEAQAKKNTQYYEDLKNHPDADPAGREEFEHLLSIRKQYNVALHPAHVQVAAHQADAARETLLSAMPLQQKLLEAQSQYSAFQKAEMDKAVKESESVYATARFELWGIFALSLAVSLVLGWLMMRSITRPLQQVVEGAKALADGDLSVSIDVQRTDEVGDLSNAVNGAIRNLAALVGNVKASAESIASATQEVASGNQDLSRRTEEQAASLEETAASMEELTATVRQNSESARQANSLAVAASSKAARGGDVMTRVVDTMHGISESSAKVADIVSVIESIAFQTNILALNAAVEAARAGEQGRGFAVVASEVRALAQRSAQAAKEVKGLIGAAVDQVGAGTGLVDEAGAAMTEIVQAIQRVSDLMEEISAASQEQTTGIEQVTSAMNQMDQATQQNAALVEEATAAAESMAAQAHTLREAVTAFKLN
ncbi:methyl-accepting chemotaxis protein [Burkholderia multivorans]|nr:methyl-accepting chemotaxis protein [Burkholderia multivorans]